MSRFLVSSFLLGVSFLLAPLAATATPITIDTVPVGNAGNAGELSGAGVLGGGYGPDAIVGGVAYNYRIGTTEVTVGQYTAFLNAVAATDDYGLYNTSMATILVTAGIARTGSSGGYSYSVIGSPNKPVAWVSWGDAARFANWLHNNQPMGLQDASTTEDGTYTLNGAISDAALSSVSRNSGAVWFIPSEDEWYKAAYHKNDGVTGNYWDYPTSTDSVPYSVQPPGSDAPTQSNAGNFYQNGFAATGSDAFDTSQNYTTDAGAYTLSVSPYGTYDQGGNVWEWNEALISGSFRGSRGGSFADLSVGLQSSTRYFIDPSIKYGIFGFRVATVPEPSTAVLAIVGCALMWVLRKRLK